MLTAPIDANRTNCEPVLISTLRGRCSGSDVGATVARPAAMRRTIRQIPCRSAFAVATTSTRESGSSTQSTGTSWIRKPLCSASTSSSVSKNQPWSSTMGSSTSATSWRIALKPHCASENPARSVAFKSKL